MHTMTPPSKRAQFTLGTLILSTSLVGAGIGCFAIGFRTLEYIAPNHNLPWWLPVFALVQTLAAGPLLGAGILLPFRRARIGIYIGFFLPIALAFTAAIIAFGWRGVFG